MFTLAVQSWKICQLECLPSCVHFFRENIRAKYHRNSNLLWFVPSQQKWRPGKYLPGVSDRWRTSKMETRLLQKESLETSFISLRPAGGFLGIRSKEVVLRNGLTIPWIRGKDRNGTSLTFDISNYSQVQANTCALSLSLSLFLHKSL